MGAQWLPWPRGHPRQGDGAAPYMGLAAGAPQPGWQPRPVSSHNLCSREQGKAGHQPGVQDGVDSGSQTPAPAPAPALPRKLPILLRTLGPVGTLISCLPHFLVKQGANMGTKIQFILPPAASPSCRKPMAVSKGGHNRAKFEPQTLIRAHTGPDCFLGLGKDSCTA